MSKTSRHTLVLVILLLLLWICLEFRVSDFGFGKLPLGGTVHMLLRAQGLFASSRLLRCFFL
jgi:hypothetical protein